MYCVCFEGLPVREVVPDSVDGMRVNVAASIESDYLQFPTEELAAIFADFLEEVCYENFIKIRKVI